MPRAAADRRPGRADLAAAAGATIPDVLAPGIVVLMCGINPSLYSAATGHHFARPGNRFWRALHGAGFTDRILDPSEDATLVRYGVGLTNLVARATASAADLEDDEVRAGAGTLGRAVARLRPRAVAVLGIGAYRAGFGRPRARPGPQDETIEGASLWVLPNPSGLNASYQLPDLVEAFAALRRTL